LSAENSKSRQPISRQPKSCGSELFGSESYQLCGYSLTIESGVDTSLISEALGQQSRGQVASLASEQSDLNLRGSDYGLKLQWHSKANGKLDFIIDVESLAKQHHSFPIAKQGAFNQAIGRKSKTIIDASGGWGSDALLMAMQGYRVISIERQPVMALLLQDAFSRFARTDWVQRNNIHVPSVWFADAQSLFDSKQLEADCVYFDPMFPPKRKKSAGVNKQMQLLQWLVGQDTDAVKVIEAALTAGIGRVAIKRPTHAQPLFDKPSVQFSSKLVHYDVYLSP